MLHELIDTASYAGTGLADELSPAAVMDFEQREQLFCLKVRDVRRPSFWRIELLIGRDRWEPLTTIPARTGGMSVTADEAYRIAMDQVPHIAAILGECPARMIPLDGYYREIGEAA